MRVAAPVSGNNLPVVILSHGQGRNNYLSSLEGYAPLAEFWASRGFAVIQPTHLNSKSLNIEVNNSNDRQLVESRAMDISFILYHLEQIEETVPLWKGRIDKTRVAHVGHSAGTIATAFLLGARNIDPRDGRLSILTDNRIKAGIIIGGLGAGGSSLTAAGAERLPYYDMDFNTMRKPALIVYGGKDASLFSHRGPEWHLDPFTLSPGPKDALLVNEANHCFGDISGWDAAECVDEDPERLAFLQRMTTAWLRHQLCDDHPLWEDCCSVLEGELSKLGQVVRK